MTATPAPSHHVARVPPRQGDTRQLVRRGALAAATASTRVILVAAHLLAAAIILPALSQQRYAGSSAPITGERRTRHRSTR